jgi:AbiJ N-terminal domain 4
LASNRFWATIQNTTSREAGLPYLGRAGEELDERCIHYLIEATTEDALNIIEISCRVIDLLVRRALDSLSNECGVIQHPDDAIKEINHRFKEHGIGYQYANGMLFKIDSQFLHAEAVKPALTLLNTKGFEGPAQEFMAAFDHFRPREK